jgi:hypothetical protein
MLTVNAASGFGSGGGGYTANAVAFDGTNDYLTRGADIGGSDGKQMICSFWVNFTGGDGTLMKIFSTSNDRFYIERQADNKFKMVSKKTDGSTWMYVMSSTTTTVSDGWTHIMWYIRADHPTNPGHVRLFIDGVNTGQTGSGGGDATMDWTSADWAIGATTAGGEKLEAEIADFYLITGFYLTLETESEIRKWRSADGKPVNLGDDGSEPSGSTPQIYFTGETASWHTNVGSGGGFTENGALTDGASSPSD